MRDISTPVPKVKESFLGFLSVPDHSFFISSLQGHLNVILCPL